MTPALLDETLMVELGPDRCTCDLYGPASCPTCRDEWERRHPERCTHAGYAVDPDGSPCGDDGCAVGCCSDRSRG